MVQVPVIAPVLKGVLVVQLVEPLPGLHEGKFAAEADLLLPMAPVEGSRTSEHEQ